MVKMGGKWQLSYILILLLKSCSKKSGRETKMSAEKQNYEEINTSWERKPERERRERWDRWVSDPETVRESFWARFSIRAWSPQTTSKSTNTLLIQTPEEGRDSYVAQYFLMEKFLPFSLGMTALNGQWLTDSFCGSCTASLWSFYGNPSSCRKPGWY